MVNSSQFLPHHLLILIPSFLFLAMLNCPLGLTLTKLPTAAGLLTQKWEHISPVTASLHWLPVRFWSDFKSLLFDFKYLHAVSPTHLTALHHSYTILWGSQVGHSVFVVWLQTPEESERGPKLWNQLPLLIRQADSLPVAESLLKTHFFTLAF